MKVYILNAQGQPVEEPDWMVWAQWMEDNHRHFARVDKVEGMRVSTVFLGVPHNYEDGPPVLWETLLFTSKGPLLESMRRCTGGVEQAEAMHMQALQGLKTIAAAQKLMKGEE